MAEICRVDNNQVETIRKCPGCKGSQFQYAISTKVMMENTDGSIFSFYRCKDCDLVFLNPRVKPQFLGRYYKDSYLPYRGSSAWGKHQKLVEKDQHKVDRKRIEVLQKYCSIPSTSSIWDIGCGKPDFLLQIRQKFQAQCHGIDFSDHGWAGKSQYDDLDLHVGEVNDLERIDADIVTMWHYLEHDYTPLETLQNVFSKVNKGCKIIVEVPNFDSSTQEEFGKNWAGFHTPRHTAIYNRKSINRLFEKAGWKVLDTFSNGTLDPYSLVWMSKKEQEEFDWTKSMEPEFWTYVKGMVKYRIQQKLKPSKSEAFITIVAEKTRQNSQFDVNYGH